MFWVAAARKNCSRTNFTTRRRKRRSPDLIPEFREQRFYFLSLPSCAFANPGRVQALPCSVAGRVHPCGWQESGTSLVHLEV